MAITEVLRKLGSWEIKLASTIDREMLDALAFLGHVAIVPGRNIPVAQYGDQLLDVARYVGVVRTRTWGDDGRTNAPMDDLSVGGVGMAWWLGDEDGKGAVLENAVEAASASFASTVNMLLPASGAMVPGTVYSVAGQYTGRHQYETQRAALDYVCDTMSTTSVPVAWRANGDGTVDAGPESDLFVTTNLKCVITSKTSGEDMALRALVSSNDVTRDVEDYTTRVLLLAEGEGTSIATGSADISPATAYKDIHGNPARITRLISESDTASGNAETRAQIQLDKYTATRTALTLSTTDYEIHGTFAVGDYVWVYDPDAGLVDTANEIIFRGQRLNPIKLQVTEVNWSVTKDYTVAYRTADGAWIDLTNHVDFETDATSNVTVGDLNRVLTSAGQEEIGSRPNQDASVPGIPTLIEPFVGSAYLDSRGFTRARVILAWNAPNNVDGSTVLDGDHYDIRYAVDTDMIYPATWSQLSAVRWMDLQTWAQPFAAPDGQWQTMVVGWDQTSAQLQDLSPGVGYDVQIRAVDKTGNTGAWSGTTTFVASADNLPPSTPAAPEVAGSRIAVQVTHELGKAVGGTFNLESDLHHLEVHVDYEPTFTPSESTLKGKVSATAGMIQAQIPVVATVQVEETSARYVRVVAVDITGNKSGPSDAATATALLIDDAHISDLTVSKVTAGTISADWIVGARIKTADTGPRAEMSMLGFETYNSGGTRTFFAEAATGNIDIIGQLRSGVAGKRLVVNPTGAADPEVRFYPTTGDNYSLMAAWDNAVTPASAAAIQLKTSLDGSDRFSVVAMDESTATFGRYKLNTGDGIYYATGGFVEADSTKIRTAWFSGVGGNYGGSVVAQQDVLEVGWFGPTAANWNYTTYDDDGITRHHGIWSSTSRAIGFATISPVANTPTSLTITGLDVDGSQFFGFVTAQTTAIGSTVMGVAQSGVSSTQITLWVYRTNTVDTNMDWMVVGTA